MTDRATRRAKLASVAIAMVVSLGYFSNAQLIRHLYSQSSRIRDEENRRLLAQAAGWPEKDERHSYIENRYWPGPLMNVNYSASIPFIVTSCYYFENPFDWGHMGGHGHEVMILGMFIPLKSWRFREFMY